VKSGISAEENVSKVWPVVPDFKQQNALVAICVLLIALGAAFGYTRDVQLTNAWNGWAPPTLVWASDTSTEIVGKDFLGRQNLHMGNSIVMWLYPLSYKIFRLDPTQLQVAAIYASCVFFAYSVVFLVWSLLERSDQSVAVIAVALTLLTDVVNGNFARFGQGNFSLGQYYAFAVGLQMIAVGLAIRGQPLRCSIVLALLVWVHPMIAGITGVVAAVALSTPFPSKNAWSTYLLAAALVASSATLYLTIMRDTTTSGDRMAFTDWIDWVRFGNFHWFPFEYGVFTRENTQSIAPMLGILMLVIGAPLLISVPRVRSVRWLMALAASVLLTAIGLVHSIAPFSMIITMASLHRASGLLLLLCLPLACALLIRCAKAGGVKAGLAVVTLASPLLGSYGFPMLPALATLLACSLPWSTLTRLTNPIKICLLLVVGAAVVNLWWMTTDLGIVLTNPNVAGPNSAWMLGACFAVVTRFPKAHKSRWGNNQTVFQCLFLLGFLALVAFQAHRNWEKHPLVGDKQLAIDYLQAQSWARNNTPRGSVFAVNPNHAYGWKDYSARPTWGNMRDWIHSTIVYHGDKNLFQEGLRRSRALGVDPQEYMRSAKDCKALTVVGNHYTELGRNLQTAYYSLTDETARELARTENIDYFVFEKALAPSFGQPPDFANSSFVIYRAR
jgi:hypothetical protein